MRLAARDERVWPHIITDHDSVSQLSKRFAEGRVQVGNGAEGWNSRSGLTVSKSISQVFIRYRDAELLERLSGFQETRQGRPS